MEPNTRTEIWVERVAAWRASGESAEGFGRKQGYAAGTLRWWASKLKREMSAPAPVQLARVVRTPRVEHQARDTGVIVLEVMDAGVRIAVEPGADAGTLAMVLDVVRARSGGRR